MKRSTDRILTTHTGSLPRAAEVIELLLAERQNRGVRKAELNAAVGEAIAHVVQKQIESGIDVINDGEQGRTDYTVHVIDRLAGFDGKSMPPLGTGDPEFPELAQLLTHFASPFQYRPSCTGEVTWKDCTLSQEQTLRDGRGLRVCACGYDEARIRGDRRRGLYPAA
jgi:5-methyltetrahydropteroyltriglutamate--homocysteine methyltransferase